MVGENWEEKFVSFISGSMSLLNMTLLHIWVRVGESICLIVNGGRQYCNNNAATPGAPFFNFINSVVRNKLGSDGVVCTSTSSCRGCHLISWHKSARSLSQILWVLRTSFLTDGWKLTQRRLIYLQKETEKLKGNTNPSKP